MSPVTEPSTTTGQANSTRAARVRRYGGYYYPSYQQPEQQPEPTEPETSEQPETSEEPERTTKVSIGRLQLVCEWVKIRQITTPNNMILNIFKIYLGQS